VSIFGGVEHLRHFELRPPAVRQGQTEVGLESLRKRKVPRFQPRARLPLVGLRSTELAGKEEGGVQAAT
jgi:hypothetical protein